MYVSQAGQNEDQVRKARLKEESRQQLRTGSARFFLFLRRSSERRAAMLYFFFSS
jgi:hypothetical protein